MSRSTVIQGYFPAGLTRIARANALQAKPATPDWVRNRIGGPAAPQPVQRQPAPNAEAMPLPPHLASFSTTGGQPLPPDVRQKMESFFGTRFDDVRIHTGQQAANLGALAFTQGSDIHFAPGQYNPRTPQGQQILGHELTHVVQQRAGRVRNPFGNGIAIVHDRALEAEAERMGHRAAAHQAPLQQQRVPQSPVQRKIAGPHALQAKFGRGGVVQMLSVRIGGTDYDAGWDDSNGVGFFVITAKTNKKLFLYRKVVREVDRGKQIYELEGPEAVYAQQWFNGKLVLHRGAGSDHAVYNDIKQGLIRPKPNANVNVPDFTSENSTTRFIPFSTSRMVATMAAKARANTYDDTDDITDTEVGVVATVTVGTQNSIGIFSVGEIQVLDPPVAQVTVIAGKTIGPGYKRVDGKALNNATALAYIRDRLSETYFDTLGSGAFSWKVPSGIDKMRKATTLQEIVRLAREKKNDVDKRRNPEVAALYDDVDKIGIALNIN
jgi:hypothetical protein